MELTLTYEELKATLSEHFSTKVDRVTVVDRITNPELYNLVREKVANELNTTEECIEFFIKTEKTNVIKAVQNVLHTELSRAKWIVENWQTWGAFVKDKGHIPSITFAGKFPNDYTETVTLK